jgi:hypothetical protein
VDAGHGDVERILGSLCGQSLPADERRRERDGRICDVQEREAFEHGEAPLSSVWITRTHLSQHDLRGEEVVVCPLLVPSRHGELLMGGHQQIPARSCGQVTDNARFDIDGASGAGSVCSVHGLKLPEKSGCVWIRITDFSLSVCTR